MHAAHGGTLQVVHVVRFRLRMRYSTRIHTYVGLTHLLRIIAMAPFDSQCKNAHHAGAMAGFMPQSSCATPSQSLYGRRGYILSHGITDAVHQVPKRRKSTVKEA